MAKRAFEIKTRKGKAQPMRRNSRGKRVPAHFLGSLIGGLFGGGGGGGGGGSGGGSSQSSNTYSTGVTNANIASPTQNTLREDVFGRAENLIGRDYQPYDTGQRFADFNADQLNAMQGVRNNQGVYQGNYNNAQGAFDQATSQAGGVGTAGQPAFNQALNAPTGSAAASGFLQGGTGAWTDPGVAQSYMSPYTEGVTNEIARLGNRNLFENILPGVNDTFTGGGAAQFGRERHADITGRAIRDTGESIMGQQAKALEAGYGQAANIFGADQGRQLTAGATAGNLATGDRSAFGNLGSQMTSAAAQGVSSEIAAGQAQQNLGTARQTAGYTDTTQLGNVGQMQQKLEQQKKDFEYQQNREAIDYPWKNLANAKAVGTGWQLPTNTNYTNTGNSSSSTQTQSPSGSVAGNVLGAGMTIAGMGTGGGSTVGGDIANTVGGWFGGSGSAIPTPASQGIDVGGIGGNSGFNTPTGAARGGRIKKRAFGAGGYAAVVRGARARNQRRAPAQQMRAQALQGGGGQPGQPGIMPPVMPAFAKGGVVAKKAVRAHERNMHRGKPATKFAFAEGGLGRDDMVDRAMAFAPSNQPRGLTPMEKWQQQEAQRVAEQRANEEAAANRPRPFTDEERAAAEARRTAPRVYSTSDIPSIADVWRGIAPPELQQRLRSAGQGMADMAPELLYGSLPTVAYNRMANTTRDLYGDITGRGDPDRDWIDKAGDVGSLAFDAFSMGNTAPRQALRATGLPRAAKAYLKQAFGR